MKKLVASGGFLYVWLGRADGTCELFVEPFGHLVKLGGDVRRQFRDAQCDLLQNQMCAVCLLLFQSPGGRDYSLFTWCGHILCASRTTDGSRNKRTRSTVPFVVKMCKVKRVILHLVSFLHRPQMPLLYLPSSQAFALLARWCREFGDCGGKVSLRLCRLHS